MRSSIKRPDRLRPRTSYSAAQLAAQYGYPTGVTKQTAWVAVVSLGGGFSMADVQAYCAKYNLPVPPVKFISVLGATNDYSGNPNSADGENALDIQNIVGASGGMVGILVYTAPNTSAGFAAAIKQAIADGVACVGTISWGQDEASWSAADRAAMDDEFEASPIPWFAASGDDGSSDGDPGNNVDYPASSPYAIGVGGTTQAGAAGEAAWSYGGGGPSHVYPLLSYQTIGGSGRAVPDMAANADPNTGYPIVISGQWQTFGGTSAVGPMLAAAVALVVSLTGKRMSPGTLIQAIYSGVLTDITTGSNGAYQAQPGEDYCTGMGTPNKAFWAALIASAGGVTAPTQPIPTQPPTQPTQPPAQPVVATQPLSPVLGVVNSVCRAAEAKSMFLCTRTIQALNAAMVLALQQLYGSASSSDLKLILRGVSPMGLSATTLAALNQAAADESSAAALLATAQADAAKAQSDAATAQSAHATASAEGLAALALAAAELGIAPGTPIPAPAASTPSAPAAPSSARKMKPKLQLNWGPIIQSLEPILLQIEQNLLDQLSGKAPAA